MKRRFEYQDDKSHKFWEIELDGRELTVRFGKSGTKGQTRTKSFPDQAAADKEAQTKIREKCKKGYEETGESPPAAASPGKTEKTIKEKVDWALDTHRADPSVFWKTMESPLRSLLHQIRESGIQLSPEEVNQLWAPFESAELARRAISRDPGTPDELLIKLIDDENDRIRGNVAENKSSPPEALAGLAKKEKSWIAHRVAGNPNTTAEVLKLLAEREPSQVARHPNTPVKVLEKLAALGDEDVEQDLAGNPSIPPGMLPALAKSKNQYAVEHVAENPETPPEVLAAIARGTNWRARAIAATHPGLPADALEELATADRSKNKAIAPILRGAAAANPKLPAKLRSVLLEDKDEKVRMAAAAAAPASMLKKLSTSPDPMVRGGVAANPAVEAALLEKLSKDKQAKVRAEVALPDHARVANDISDEAFQRKARASRAPLGVLEALAGDSDKQVRFRVAENPRTPPEVLARLASDKEERVRSAVAWHRETPVDTLAELLMDKDAHIVDLTARNRRTPKEAINKKIQRGTKRLLGMIEKGRIDAKAVAGRRLVHPEVLARLIPGAPEEVADNPRTLLEDLLLYKAEEAPAPAPGYPACLPEKLYEEARALLIWGMQLKNPSLERSAELHAWASSAKKPAGDMSVQLNVRESHLINDCDESQLIVGVVIREAFGVDGDHRTGLSLDEIESRIQEAKKLLKKMEPDLDKTCKDASIKLSEPALWLDWSGPLAGARLVFGEWREEAEDEDYYWHKSRKKPGYFFSTEGGSQDEAPGGAFGLEVFENPFDGPGPLKVELTRTLDEKLRKKLAKEGLDGELLYYLFAEYD